MKTKCLLWWGAQGEQRIGKKKLETGKHEERHGADVVSLVCSHFLPSPLISAVSLSFACSVLSVLQK